MAVAPRNAANTVLAEEFFTFRVLHVKRNLIYAHKKLMALRGPSSMKLTNTQQYFKQISCTKFFNRFEKSDINLFTPLRKVRILIRQLKKKKRKETYSHLTHFCEHLLHLILPKSDNNCREYKEKKKSVTPINGTWLSHIRFLLNSETVNDTM
jgi:hypothetical protein